jgi:hypothetical protein
LRADGRTLARLELGATPMECRGGATPKPSGTADRAEGLVHGAPDTVPRAGRSCITRISTTSNN